MSRNLIVLDSKAKIWGIGFYFSLALLVVGLALLAAPFLTTALDVEEQRVAFARGQAGLKSVRAENVSLDWSPFSYYVVTSIPNTIPTSVLLRTGTVKLYRYPDQLIYASSQFYYDTGSRTGSCSVVPDVPGSGNYTVEADVEGLYWRNGDRLDVEVVRMSRPALVIGVVLTPLAVAQLAVTLIMLRKHKITLYGLTLEQA